METRIEAGETQELTYRNILNIREEPTTKVDQFMNDALGWDRDSNL